ncbi:cellulose biosynthesis protein BcsP [Undibacterium oligocarboniphilum]|nr:cellulose biosynthesis protein BcsP [Undibacterium oligocarboniphilum]MBC3869216.1 hypothetical protein [Undibacterium oligocarboniphilum]
MDDDVKNLFQKFGHTGSGYQEINRETESEQARQRWPLLRDVRVYTMPDHFSHADTSQTAFHAAHPAVSMESDTSVPAANTRELPVFLKRQDTETEAPYADKPQAVAAAAETPRRSETAPSPSFIAQALGKTTETISASRPENIAPSDAAYSKEHSVTEVFQRLANKPEPARDDRSTVNSFFKKIFKP